jgi:signal transduction histidine kinase
MLLRDQLGKREVDVRVSGAEELRCDPDQVTQILVNLLSNGLDAAGDKGAVGVVWTATREGAELVVWDTGPGITGDPARIFAPWYTTKPRGTGLGLAITQRIVRAHGWTIDPERRDGKTRLVISIPAADVVEPVGVVEVTDRRAPTAGAPGRAPHVGAPCAPDPKNEVA